MKRKVKIVDSMFSHVKYSTIFQESKYMCWDRNILPDEELVIYTDFSVQNVSDKVKHKIAWLLESPDITPQAYDWISKNNKKFDYVLTHQKNFLDRGENFIFSPTGGCWIKPEDQKIYDKTKNISIIASGKRMTHGQKLRHLIIGLYNNKMDVYGRGYSPVEYKLDALKEYMFSVTIENTNKDYYFSEKLIDCFMTGTIPIYFGPPSIGKFFNEKGIIMFQDDDFDIDSLNEELYDNMLPYIRENFEKAKEYIIAEDYIYKNLIENMISK